MHRKNDWPYCPNWQSRTLVCLVFWSLQRSLRFVGFFAFEWQIRADSALVIDALKTSGHAVAVGTEDAPLTALHVASNSCFADLAPSELLRCRGDESPCWTMATGDRREKHRKARLRIWPSRSTLRSQMTPWRLSFSRSTIFPSFLCRIRMCDEKWLRSSTALITSPNVRLIPAREQGQKQKHLSNGRAGAPPPCEGALQPPILG